MIAYVSHESKILDKGGPIRAPLAIWDSIHAKPHELDKFLLLLLLSRINYL